MFSNNLLKSTGHLIFLLFLVSCSNDNRDSKYFLQDTISVSSEEISLDSILGAPYQIGIIDNFLIVSDLVDNKLLSIFDLNRNDMIRRVINVGRGPEEMIAPLYLDISSKNKVLGILQRQTGIYTEHKLADLLEGFVGLSNKINLGNIERVVQTKNGYLTEGFYPNDDIGFYSKTGELIKTMSIFPAYLKSVGNVSDRYRLGQGQIAYNEQSGIFLYASCFTGDICFFSFSNDQLIKIKEYNLDNKIANRIKNNPGDVKIRPDDLEHAEDIASTSDYFYILYSRETMQNRKNAKSSYILKFDSKGEFTCCYKSDRKFFNICVTENDKMIYTVVLTEDLDYSLAKVVL
jgi:hypothetical protein